MLPERKGLPDERLRWVPSRSQFGPLRRRRQAQKVITQLRYKASGLLESVRYASAGIYFMLRTQRNMRIHTAVGFSALALAVWLGVGPLELAAIIIVSSLVVICEMFNTAVENAVDLATHRRHPLAKAAKDVAAAAVLSSSLTAVLVGVLVLGPRLWERLSGILHQ